MDRPNIVFIFADQHRFDAVGCNDNNVIRTPNMDRMAAEGMNCQGALSSHPLCSPFRAQLLTAQYGWKNGVIDNEYKFRDGTRTVAHVLGEAGYRTYYLGKWHLGPGPYPADKRFGFDYLNGHNAGTPYYDGKHFENDEREIQLSGWTPTAATDLAFGYMDEHREKTPDQPIALFMSWQPPHWRYDQFPKECDKYDPGSVPVPANVPEEMDPFARKEIAQYYGNVTALDIELGRVLDYLDENSMRENTIVCYSSDHGDHLSSHGYVKPWKFWAPPHLRASKGTPYEESVHVPFIVRYPDAIPAGATTDGLFGTIDIMPSFLGLAGLEFGTDDRDGIDLSAGFRGDESAWRDSVYMMNMGLLWPFRDPTIGCWRGVRTRRYTYARWIEGDQGPLLFDRDSDPAEMHNIAPDPANASVVAELEAELKRHMAESEDPFETGPRNPVTGELDLGFEYASERWANHVDPPLHERLAKDPWKRPPK